MNDLTRYRAATLRLVTSGGLAVVLLVAAGCSPGDRDQGASMPDAAGQAAAGETVAPATATVLDYRVRSTDPDVINEEILTRLFDRYAEERGIEASEAEIETFIDDMRRGMAADPDLGGYDDLTAEERTQVDEMRREMARAMITRWKINRAMYEQYGGRVIGQQLGPEPLDAYRQFLEEQQQAGNFEIDDPGLEASFWRYFRDDTIHSFLDPDAAAAAFAAPPWERP